MNKTILLIVEGPRDEEEIVKKLWDRFDKGVDYCIISYKTNIHVLIHTLFRDGMIDEDVDVVKALRSSEVPKDIRLDSD